MTLAKLRRSINLLLVIALAAGLVTQGVWAADMGARMTMAASTMPMPDKCDGCTGDGCVSLGACSVACGNFLALSVASAAFDMLPPAAGVPGAVPARVGWSAPPDPYPPRPAVLS